MIWPFGGEPDSPIEFEYPDRTGKPVHIYVPRPPQLISGYTQGGGLAPAGAPIVLLPAAQAYANWIAIYLPAQANKPGRTLADLMTGLQSGSDQADFGQAKRYAYFKITGYEPEAVPVTVRPEIVSITPTAPATPPATGTTAAQAVTNAQAASAVNAATSFLTSTEPLFGFPRLPMLLGLGLVGFMLLKGK